MKHKQVKHPVISDRNANICTQDTQSPLLFQTEVHCFKCFVKSCKDLRFMIVWVDRHGRAPVSTRAKVEGV